MTYTGPAHIVILGGGLAGLAAADAISQALAEYSGELPQGMSVTLIEGEHAVGGRAISAPVEEVRELHPHGPYRAHVPHGIHFVWGCYEHFIRFAHGAGPPLVPGHGTSTYCAWLAPPDLAHGDAARVVALHVCNPETPDQAWSPRARAVLRAVARSSRAIEAIEQMLGGLFNRQIALHDYLSYLDILFAEDDLGPELRWRIFGAGVFASVARLAETSSLLQNALGGRNPPDVDIGELMQPMAAGFTRFRRPSVRHARVTDDDLDAAVLSLEDEEITSMAGRLLDDVRAVSSFAGLIARDAARFARRLGRFHPKRSGYLKNILKAAFSSPFALDTATAIRDAQFGLRNHRGSMLRTFDADDSRSVCEAVRRRIEARLDGRRLRGSVRTGTWVRRVKLHENGRVAEVELSDAVARPPAPVPTIRPAKTGDTSDVVEADIVVSSLLPQNLAAVLPNAPRALLDRLDLLSRHMNETINLQLFFPERHELPFPSMPEGSREVAPLSISNIEGPFTIVVDCARAWSPAAFAQIALTREDAEADRPFTGTAWELVGAYADLFTHDAHAHPGRYQWPLAAQQKLAALLHDPRDFVPGTTDDRPWVHDADAPGRPPPPTFGEIRPERVAEYLRRWKEEAAPLITAHAMRQLGEMPGMRPETRRYLATHANFIERGEPSEVKWMLVRNCQAENRFFSAEPGLFGARPHARFETDVPGLFVCGDWTRNGLNLQSMEAAVISGLQSAHAVIERLRAAGLDEIRPPRLSPDILPQGAWDTGS